MSLHADKMTEECIKYYVDNGLFHLQNSSINWYVGTSTYVRTCVSTYVHSVYVYTVCMHMPTVWYVSTVSVHVLLV